VQPKPVSWMDQFHTNKLVCLSGILSFSQNVIVGANKHSGSLLYKTK